MGCNKLFAASEPANDMQAILFNHRHHHRHRHRRHHRYHHQHWRLHKSLIFVRFYLWWSDLSHWNCFRIFFPFEVEVESPVWKKKTSPPILDLSTAWKICQTIFYLIVYVWKYSIGLSLIMVGGIKSSKEIKQ